MGGFWGLSRRGGEQVARLGNEFGNVLHFDVLRVGVSRRRTSCVAEGATRRHHVWLG